MSDGKQDQRPELSPELITALRKGVTSASSENRTICVHPQLVMIPLLDA
jgi:hypothetical protein